MINCSDQFYLSIESLIFLKEIQKGFPLYVNFPVSVLIKEERNIFLEMVLSAVVIKTYISTRV
jgi:hypothetical protein